MKKMSLIRGVRRICVGSLEPIQINESFREILDEPWLERHLHIAIQHSSDSMLRIMNRRNRHASDVELFGMLNAKGFALGTDFIVGHPGESDAIWEEAMDNIRSLYLTHIHPFTYSKRDGTPSSLMKPEVNGALSAQRMSELNALIESNNRAFRQKMASTPLEVLVESAEETGYMGYDQFYNKVIIQSSEDISGDWITLENYEVHDEYNMAKF
jgi:tRNA A37 methylthiotransferase MiaB